jgi:hypothetical protein
MRRADAAVPTLRLSAGRFHDASMSIFGRNGPPGPGARKLYISMACNGCGGRI